MPWGRRQVRTRRSYAVRIPTAEERDQQRSVLTEIARDHGHSVGPWAPVQPTAGEKAHCVNAGCHAALGYGVRFEDQSIYQVFGTPIQSTCPYDKYWRKEQR